MQQQLKRVFELNDGAALIRLIWKSSEKLPDFASAPVFAARLVPDCGFSWAVAKTSCLHCGHSFVIGRETKLQTWDGISHVPAPLLTPDAAKMIHLVGNIAATLPDRILVQCPSCHRSFPASCTAWIDTFTVQTNETGLVIARSCGQTIHFMGNGTVHALMTQFPGLEVYEFRALPRFLGFSEEARAWLHWALGIRDEESERSDAIDILNLALRYRFKDYPNAFLADAYNLISQRETESGMANALFALPRNYSDRSAMSGLITRGRLPDRPSVRRAAATRPAILAIISSIGLGIVCGDDPNVAVTLLKSDRLDPSRIGCMLDSSGNLSKLIQAAALEEKPGYLVNWLLNVSRFTLTHCISAFEKLNLGHYDTLKAYHSARKDRGFMDIVERPYLLLAYREDISIKYGRRSALQGEYGGYKFSLPKKTSSLLAAGAALKNCLGNGYGASVASGSTLIFLVSKNTRLVAAVEVSPASMTVRQMYAKANRKISPAEELGEAIALWAADKGISLNFESTGACI